VLQGVEGGPTATCLAGGSAAAAVTLFAWGLWILKFFRRGRGGRVGSFRFAGEEELFEFVVAVVGEHFFENLS